MADRTDLPKIKPTEKPTIFNREAGGWGFLSAFAGSIAGMIVGGGSIVRDVLRNPAMSKEDTYRAAKNSSGKMLGILGVTTAAGVVLGGLKGLDRQKKEQAEGRVVKTPTIWNSGIFSGWLVGGLISAAANHALLHAGRIPSAFLGIASVGTGIVVGSNMRKNSMQRDFDQAVAIREGEADVARARLHTLEQTVLPQGAGKSHTARLAEERSAAEQGVLRA